MVPWRLLMIVIRECNCFLPTEPPVGVKWWRPDLGDDEPGPGVRAVARHGEDPNQRRAVRRDDGTSWDERGSMVDFYVDLTPPLPWARAGRCWADTPHPVVAATEGPDGKWLTDA